MIKQLLNSAIAKYRDLSVSRRCLRHRQIIDLLATDKSRYFAQSRPIIVYYYMCMCIMLLQTSDFSSCELPLVSDFSRIFYLFFHNFAIFVAQSVVLYSSLKKIEIGNIFCHLSVVLEGDR